MADIIENMTIDELIGKLNEMNFITNLFDTIRLIEGPSHSVLKVENGKFADTGQKCFSLWNRCEKCRNCVSYQASQANHKMVKLEYFNDQYYFVMANPLIVDGKRVVLELVTNITAQLAINPNDVNDENFVHDLICKLESVSVKDTSTGAYNKKFLEQQLQRMIDEKKCSNTYLAIFDLDNFKNVNDTYGHMAGDSVILKFVDIVNEVIMKYNSYIARFGGDEFVVVFEDISNEMFTHAINTICDKFASVEFKEDNGNIFHCTVSVGNVKITSEYENFERIIHEADKELYKQKQEKHCV